MTSEKKLPRFFGCIALIVVSVIGLSVSAFQQPVFAQADEPTGYKNVTLWINPEYDDPRLLVMVEGQIVGATAPVTVRFLVPQAAEMFSAGSKDAQGKYTGGPPDRKASGIPGWDEISYQLKTDIFRVEYYDPVINGQTNKTISCDFRTLLPINGLRVLVQEPRNSSAFTVLPEGTTGRDGEGFAVHNYSFDNVGPDKPLHFDIAYTKFDSKPSLKNPPLGGTGGATQSTAGDNTALILSMLLTVVAVIASMGIWVIKYRGKNSRSSRPARKEAARAAVVKRPGKSKFCSQCGRQVESAARFCPRCGKKLS